MPAFADAVRINVHLPTYDLDHIQAALQVVSSYKYKYGGSTCSAINNSKYTGTWRYKRKGDNKTRLYESSVAILTVDIIFDRNTQRKDVPVIVDDIKTKAAHSYSAFGCKQKAIWITVVDLMVSG